MEFRECWDRYGRHDGECLEIGCGAGRMTKWLCADFHHVSAIDVSAGMIAAARANLENENVGFTVTNGTSVPLESNSVSAAFSTHVFQHLPDPEAGAAYFREIWRVLVPGSTLMIHAPLIIYPRGASRNLQLGLHRLVSALVRLAGVVKSCAYALGIRKQPVMSGTWYEVEWLYQTMRRIGFARIQFHIQHHDTQMGEGSHAFVFATKPL
jgi:ubiquinone/menaquinone biosynthesis C-methylase UbiE